jgi:protein involved in polysaccharide export with SLBB domain
VKTRFLPALGTIYLAASFAGAMKCMADPPIQRIYMASAYHIFFQSQIKEGALTIPPGEMVTASQAIITDGGLLPLSDWKNIRIHRKYPDGSIVSIPVNMDDIINQGHLEHDPVVEAGDIIIVPTKTTDSNSPPH